MQIDTCGHKKISARLGFVIIILGGLMATLEPMRELLHGYYHIAFMVVGGLQAGAAYVKQNLDKKPCAPDEHEEHF